VRMNVWTALHGCLTTTYVSCVVGPFKEPEADVRPVSGRPGCLISSMVICCSLFLVIIVVFIDSLTADQTASVALLHSAYAVYTAATAQRARRTVYIL